MKVSIINCPKCGVLLWPQMGNKQEQEKGISYRVCTSHYCDFRMQVTWDKKENKIKILKNYC